MQPLEIRLHSQAPDWWDTEVEAAKGLFCHTSKWANFLKTTTHTTTSYLELLHNNKRVMLLPMHEGVIGASMLANFPTRSLAFLRKIPGLQSITTHLAPLVCDVALQKNESELILATSELVKYISKYAVQHKLSILPADIVCFDHKESAIELQKLHTTVAPKLLGTVRVSTAKSHEELYSSLDYSERNKIKKAEKSGIETKFINKSEVASFYAALKQSWSENNLAVPPLKYYQTLMDMYPEDVHYCVAMFDGRIISGSGVLSTNNTAQEFSMFSTRYSRDHKLPGGDAVKWALFKFCSDQGLLFLDLSMIAVSTSDDLEDKIKNINQMKTKWQGDIVYGIAIERVSEPIDIARKIKRKFIGI